MSALTAKAVLRRIPDVEIRLDANNRVVIGVGHRRFLGSIHSLTILAELSQPRSVGEVLDRLRGRVRGVEDWKDLTATLVRLYESGILRDETQQLPEPRNPPVGYDAAAVHVEMLNDRVRTKSFIAGIRAVVRPGDVVVEIGTGTGILSVAAAQAGARHVYTIEETGIGESAERVFAANGMSDRITFVKGRSTQVELPLRGDVLVSEMIGNEPLGERVIQLTADAVERLLKADARLVPSKIRVFGLPVTTGVIAPSI